MNGHKHKIKYGIIGFGSYAENRLIPAFRKAQHSELHGITKRNHHLAEEKAKKYAIARYYSDPIDLVSDTEVDAVIICSPPGFHHQHTLLSASHGKHVMVEKPIATHSDEVRDMIKSCNQNNVKMMAAFVMRFIETIREIRQILKKGELGKLDFIESHIIMNASLIQREWISDPKISGGGPVSDLASHFIDLLWYMVDRKILQVRSITHPPINFSQIERKAAISFLFQDGIMANLYVSFDAFRESSLTFYGSEGKLHVRNFNRTDTTVEIEITKDEIQKKIAIRNSYYHTYMLDHYSKALLFGKEIITPGEVGLENQKIIDQIYSANTNNQ